jgi:hypothetical protein
MGYGKSLGLRNKSNISASSGEAFSQASPAVMPCLILFDAWNALKTNIERDTLFWFYSSSAQVFAALMAIGGVFIVYRLQDQRSKIKEAYEDARALLKRIGIGDSEMKEVADSGLNAKLSSIFDKSSDESTRYQIDDARKTIQKRKEGEIWIRNQRILPLRLTTTALALSLILLPLHRLIVKINDDVNAWLFLGMLGLSIVSVYSVGNLIKKMIEKDQSGR